MLNAIFSNISAISWQPVLVVEEAGVPGKNHRPWTATQQNKTTEEHLIKLSQDKSTRKLR